MRQIRRLRNHGVVDNASDKSGPNGVVDQVSIVVGRQGKDFSATEDVLLDELPGRLGRSEV